MSAFQLGYGVGPLLYCPAANATVSDSIINEKFGTGFSLALCLEDTIDDNRVEEAEEILIHTFNTLFAANQRGSQSPFDSEDRDSGFFVPKLFIRVREPRQISDICRRLGPSLELLQGFTIPKFAPENASVYISEILSVNQNSPHPIYMMPIIENPTVIDLRRRYEILYELKDRLDAVSELVLNVRVGGNDLCHAFGFRRQSTECIYDISPVAQVLSDVISVFGMDYVLSGPVWEYYNGCNWKEGLEYELTRDRLNGFVGKTVIHPKQISSVNKAYMVSRSDYNDACSILNWDKDKKLLVSGSTDKARMNERKTHSNWARKIIALSEFYGIN